MSTMHGRWMAVAACAALAACARPEREPAEAAPARQTAPEASPAARDTSRRISPDAPPRDTRPWVPVIEDTFAAPRPTPAATPSVSPAQGRQGEWTTGAVERKSPPGLGPVTVRHVRTGTHAGWDRVVFELAGGTLPGYRVEYVRPPVTQCGSGDAVRLAGAGVLQVSLTPARAHSEAGRATVTQRERTLAHPVLRALRVTCDFEADVTVALGVARAAPFRVQELSNPARLVVDVRR
jgi:hypothetical protein